MAKHGHFVDNGTEVDPKASRPSSTQSHTAKTLLERSLPVDPSGKIGCGDETPRVQEAAKRLARAKNR